MPKPPRPHCLRGVNPGCPTSGAGFGDHPGCRQAGGNGNLKPAGFPSAGRDPEHGKPQIGSPRR